MGTGIFRNFAGKIADKSSAVPSTAQNFLIVTKNLHTLSGERETLHPTSLSWLRCWL